MARRQRLRDFIDLPAPQEERPHRRIGRWAALLGLGLLTVGCALPPETPNNTYGPRSRCLEQPQRGQNYSPDRPLVYLFCVESP